ncbi:MAG: SDR family oxidoreductase [Pseudomonadota bacterium]
MQPQGWTIIGTTRQTEKRARLIDEGIIPLVWPGSDLIEPLSRATHLLISVGPDRDGDPVLDALEDRITAIASNIRWAGYLSTTGVYGDHQGGWVDENTPLIPSTERGERRVRAEKQWQALAARTGLPLHIFRLAGIYGPGRGPFAKIKTGKSRRIIKKNQVFSRIHVDDIAQTLAASIARPDPGAIYNLCDDEAAPPQDVIAYAAALLGVPVPPAVPIERAEMSHMARSFYAENKRVRNGRIRDELGVDLIYPDYRVGLQALLAEEGLHPNGRDAEG